MPKFKFDLGAIVVLDPTGARRNSQLGKIIGRIEFIDGSVGYMVSCSNIESGINRHVLNEYEIHALDHGA